MKVQNIEIEEETGLCRLKAHVKEAIQAVESKKGAKECKVEMSHVVVNQGGVLMVAVARLGGGASSFYFVTAEESELKNSHIQYSLKKMKTAVETHVQLCDDAIATVNILGTVHKVGLWEHPNSKNLNTVIKFGKSGRIIWPIKREEATFPVN